MPFAVITDTAGNLPKNLVTEKNIYVIALPYYVDGRENVCYDVENFDGKAFYDRMREGVVVTTSQLTPQVCADVFELCMKRGEDVLYVSMASGISGTFNSVHAAAELLREKYPDRRVRAVDTMGAALGEGFVALKAAEYRDQGMDVDAAADKLREYSYRVCNVFTVDDLMFLRRSGRLSNIAAVVGTVLGIKPLLKGSTESKIVAFARVRGRKKSVEALAERYAALVVNPSEQRIGIVHADCQEDADMLSRLIRSSGKAPREIMTVGYEPVTGSHVGPGALALFFEGDENVRDELDSIGSTAAGSLKGFLSAVRSQREAIGTAIRAKTADRRQA